MSYEINVALNGTHYFATHKRSLQTANEDEVKELANVLEKAMQDAFPDKKVDVSISKYQTVGQQIER